MELVLNRYRLQLFEKTMDKDEYDFLYNEENIKNGTFCIELSGGLVYLSAKIKRTKIYSISSETGEELSNNLFAMYKDIAKYKDSVNKIE